MRSIVDSGRPTGRLMLGTGVFLRSAVSLVLFAMVCSCNSLPGGWFPRATKEEQAVHFERRLESMRFQQFTPAQPAADARADHRRWLLGLSGMLSVRNFQGVDRLAPGQGDFVVRHFQDILRRDWGVLDAADLRRQIDWCRNEGHSAGYERALRTLGTPVGPRLSPDRVQILQRFGALTGARSLHAWDLGRAAWLCRIGFMVGYLTEDEAWQLLEELGERLSRDYRSWYDFGANYCVGRVYWGGLGEVDRTLGHFEGLVGWFGAWTSIPWPKGRGASS